MIVQAEQQEEEEVVAEEQGNGDVEMLAEGNIRCRKSVELGIVGQYRGRLVELFVSISHFSLRYVKCTD